MKKRIHKQEHSTDRWLLTYADMITLLMAFFIMMYSMSILNLSKFNVAAISIKSGFNGVAKGEGVGITSRSGISEKDNPTTGNSTGMTMDTMKPLVAYAEIKYPGTSKGVSITKDRRGIVVSLRSDKMLYTPGTASLKPEVLPLLDKLAEALNKMDNCVQIEGHTCNLPISSDRFRDNWDLSTARATSVLRYLTEMKGLDSRRFSAAGYGDSKPILPNTSEANRQRNRRVEIVILQRPKETGFMPEDDATADTIKRSETKNNEKDSR